MARNWLEQTSAPSVGEQLLMKHRIQMGLTGHSLISRKPAKSSVTFSRWASSGKAEKPMNFTPIIKEVGRGAAARGLDAATASEAFAALLDGGVSDIQLGAWWLAMRIKGETPDELATFVGAMQASLAFRC